MAAAASMTMIPSSASCLARSHHAIGHSSTTSTSAPLRTSHSARLISMHPVRCSSSNNNERSSGRSPVAEVPTPSSLTDSIDRSTKQELSRADIERHQAETISEKQSVLGKQPPASAPWPRPELERRPETGDRSLGSLFAIDGAAPETINGRMAMVGFVWAVVAERLTGLTVMEQLFNPATSGILWFGAVVQLFTFASIIPFVKGESTDARVSAPSPPAPSAGMVDSPWSASPASSLSRPSARRQSSTKLLLGFPTTG